MTADLRSNAFFHNCESRFLIQANHPQRYIMSYLSIMLLSMGTQNISIQQYSKMYYVHVCVLCGLHIYQLLVNSFGMHVHVKRSNIPRSILLIHVVYIQCIHTYKNDTSVLSNVYLLVKIEYTIGFFVYKI